MAWTKLQYNKNQINKAGLVLISNKSSEHEISNATSILNNWRSSHSFPLHIFNVRLKRKSEQIDESPLVIRRLKRNPSILKKLIREQTNKMKMSRMQDVGGCRAVLSNIELVNKLAYEYYAKGKKDELKHIFKNKKDYIINPKKDGYRSIHLIYKYKSDKKEDYNGLLIEIQIRTKLQHYWATAVETVDHFTKQAIKSNEGNKEWMNFFKLISSEFANIEGSPIVPDTPTNRNELKKQIKILANELDVIKKMTEWTKIHKIIEDFEKNSKKKYGFYLLNLDLTTKELKISAFDYSHEDLANNEYSRLEKEMIKNKEDRDIVLVSADTTKELKKAYPNYFLDTREFINQLNTILK